MNKKGPSLGEILLAAAKWVPGVWTAEGNLNRTALSRYFEDQGHPLSQPTLHRLFADKTPVDKKSPRKLSPETVEAVHAVLKIPRSMLRGEPMSADTERAITQFGLDVFLLAQRIAELPFEYRENLVAQIDERLKREADLKKALEAGTVIPINRRSSPT